ncbi:MAG: serine/threonine protein kinase [Planctomycetes bacterium]|nr:serine/threonine protein kinase [Planctomycetota bacterium]
MHAPPAGGFTLGRYLVEEEIGRGGMGVVYRARQQDLDRPVALKLILPSHLASPDQVRRFHAEAQAAARARHPGIVEVYETGSAQGQHFIAMELIDGRSLDDWMEERGHDAMEAARLLGAIARAVDYLHSLGIVHRDLKPSNILVDRQGNPHVTDFGLAKVLAEPGASASGALVGTPGYMAPEQVSAAVGEIGPRTDVYGLGTILDEGCSGAHPFEADSAMAVLLKMLESEPARLTTVVPAVPRDLEAVCMRCLERSPGDRYATAAELADDLDRVLAGDPVETRTRSLLHRSRRWIRRHTALAARLLAFVVFFGVTLVNFGSGVVDGGFLTRIGVLLLVWSAGSLALDALLSRGRRADLLRHAWATVDLLLLTAILLVADGARSPLLLVYPLLLAGSGLWWQVGMVRFMTVGVLVSYGVLMVDARWRFPGESLADHHLIFVAVMVVLGVVVGQQVRRTRSLGRLLARRAPL